MTNSQEDRLITALEKIAQSQERVAQYILAIELILTIALFAMLVVLWPQLSK